nr:hypothetical protein [Clostridia bacterium]
MARKTKKYSFQRNKKKTLAWVIGIVTVIAAIVIGVVVYNSTLTGEIEVPAPDAAKLNNIAENWKVLESNTDKFLNYYSGSEDGTDGNGATMLAYMSSEAADEVYVYIKPAQLGVSPDTVGQYARPSIFTVDLGQLFAGEVSLSSTTVAIQAGDENVLIYLVDYDAKAVDASVMDAVIAELEAIIAAGPVVTETAEAAE